MISDIIKDEKGASSVDGKFMVPSDGMKSKAKKDSHNLKDYFDLESYYQEGINKNPSSNDNAKVRKSRHSSK